MGQPKSEQQVEGTGTVNEGPTGAPALREHVPTAYHGGGECWIQCSCGWNREGHVTSDTEWIVHIGAALAGAGSGAASEAYHRGVRDAVDLLLAYKLPIGPKTVTDADVINDYLDSIAKDILAHSESSQAYAACAPSAQLMDAPAVAPCGGDRVPAIAASEVSAEKKEE